MEEHIPFKTNDPQYISCYQKAVTAVHSEMTEEELAEAEEIAKEWSTQGSSREAKLK